MRVILAKSAGFCRGVRRAMNTAMKLVHGRNNGDVFTDGPLIHNQQVMKELERKGVRETTNPEKLTAGSLVIRAHGIPPLRRNFLRSLPLRLVDATCPDVGKIQGLIKKYSGRGYYIVILGDPGHAEVTGLMGFAGDKGFVITGPADVASLPPVDPVCLVAQSTQVPELFERVAAVMRKRFRKMVVLDTICQSTKYRQLELLEIARTADAIVVVGDTHSANTVRLVGLASSLKPTFHIQTTKQIKSSVFRAFKTVGVTAGASTPGFVIESVVRKLKRIR